MRYFNLWIYERLVKRTPNAILIQTPGADGGGGGCIPPLHRQKDEKFRKKEEDHTKQGITI